MMRISFYSGESLGTRGMATLVETRGLRIFIDPGVALGPRRYGLPPHRLELEAKEEQWRRIVEAASKADVVVVTHYHYDHHNPWSSVAEVYGDKDVYIKDYQNNINPSQIRRSRFFLHRLEEEGVDTSRVRVADDTTVEYGGVRIVFSPPFYHGDSPRLGYVVMVLVDDGDRRLLYTSDVEGPMYDEPLRYILSTEADTVVLDGPPTYLTSYDESVIGAALRNVSLILRQEWLETLILEHHFLRDKRYGEYLSMINGYGEYGYKIMCFAEYMGWEPRFLEMYRDELYSGEGGE